MPSKSAVKIAIAGKEYEGWYSADLDSDVFVPADAFQVSSRVPADRDVLNEIREGVSVDVYIDGDRQMAGVIDDVGIESVKDRSSLSITGRDLGAYLTDCEAKKFKAAKYTLKQLAETLIQPEWGIRKVIISNEDNRKLLLGRKDRKSKAGKGGARSSWSDKTRQVSKIDPGTRIAAILDQRTRQLGVTWWMTAQGDLFIGKPNYDQVVSYEFRCYMPGTELARTRNNCEIKLSRSMSGRYSKITMVGQGAPGGAQTIFADPIVSGLSVQVPGKGKKFVATATDPDLVARGIKRETIVTDTDALSQEDVQNHVDFDMAQRRLKAKAITVTYPGLRYEEGDRLFTADTLAHVFFEEANLDETFWVCSRRNVVQRENERTSLTLVEKDVWLA